MKRTTITLTPDLGALIERVSLLLGVQRNQAVSQNTVIVELIRAGLDAVKDQPGWREALDEVKGGGK